jgi:uncharacterized membrane protein
LFITLSADPRGIRDHHPAAMPEKVNYNRIAGQRIHRVEALSDGVFAVALTLLVLDIRVPVSQAIRTETDLFDSFCRLTPQFLTYFLSFMTLGIFWVGQSTQFSHLEKYDRNLSWISLFFLLFVSTIPFSTAFLSAHIHFRLSLGIYWLNIFLLGLMLYIHWNYVVAHGFSSLAADRLKMVSRAIRNRVLIAQGLYAAAALLCFVNIYLSIGMTILVQLNYALGIINPGNPRGNPASPEAGA